MQAGDVRTAICGFSTAFQTLCWNGAVLPLIDPPIAIGPRIIA